MDRRSTAMTSNTLHPNSTSNDLKSPVSNWSVNFLSVARDRISSLASSLATSVDGQGSFSSDSSSSDRRRRGSWSPAEAAAYFYAAQQKAQQQQQNGSLIYSIDSDLSSRSSGSSYALSPSSRGGYFNRRSTQSMKTLRTSDLAFSIPIVGGGGSIKPTLGIATQNQFQTTSFTVSGAASKKVQCGSLESVDFDEEDDDDVSSTASSVDSGVQRRLGSSSDCSFDSSSSSPSHLHHHSSPSFLRSTSGFISSDYDHSATSLYQPRGLNILDDTFTRAFGYNSLDDIELYSELNKLLESKRAGNSVVVVENHEQTSTGRRGCSKPVTRFGLGYEDHCMFPLVLPVFLNECLVKKNNSYVTWDYIKLMADAQLCRMELATLRNLNRRFDSILLPITGAPIENICPDPNLFIRNLCYQLVVEDSFHSMASRQRNRALKRWNSTDDLLSLSAGRTKLEPEFVGAKCNATKRTFTDESIGLTRTWSRIDLRASMRRKQYQAQPVSGLAKATVATRAKMSVNGKKSPNLRGSFTSNNLLFKELSTLVGQQSPVKLAQYLTRFYLDQFQSGFDVQMLAQLVLLKDISSLDRSQVNRRLRQSLLNLLTFDDTVVAVIGAHFRQISANESVEQQARAIASIIETACLLRQLRNFYGLKVIVGSLQSLPVYLMTEAWRLLAYRMPVHYCDFKRLCKLTRHLEGTILGTNKPHIPTLANLLNRLRLCCTVSWDLFEAKRRFVEHPSIAGWLQSEIIGGPTSRRQSTNVSAEAKVKFSPYPEPPLIARLSYDPISESYLTTSDPIRLISWSDFPVNWRGRYLPAIPERHLRNLLQTKAFSNMVDCFFRTPIDTYQMDSV